ncbi:hypothetical protein FNV43_RR13040 [Rhamnella rubrinervis]|uniref:Uncharacterized protein n=1 Tax=Rhamnella rubrinervis TaxID=2594499 RepID=A0A8K0H0H2_9ROSA|nr:hypothetical protein FNV43_RR13040 [Rhamnella rubrinervis]
MGTVITVGGLIEDHNEGLANALWPELLASVCTYMAMIEGYTHIHFGAVRVVLSSHGHHGVPTTVKMALLKSTFVQYEQAVITTILSTLNARSIVLTFYPNFNIPKQIAKAEHRKLIPLHWFTNYENLHNASRPFIAMDLTFQTMPDGIAKTTFQEIERNIRPLPLSDSDDDDDDYQPPRRHYHPDDLDNLWICLKGACKKRDKSLLPIYKEALEILRKE